MSERQIVACGGALFDDRARPLRDYILGLTGRARPRVCFLPTATGDHPEAIARFYRVAAAHDCRATDLSLFSRSVHDIRALLLSQDVIWVAGGNTANALAIWRVHGVDQVLREAWEAGCVMTGASAGMNCWFEASVTDSFALDRLDGLRDGLGWLSGSACPHYDSEEQRRPVYRDLIAAGFPSGVAAEDGVGLTYRGEALAEAVSWRPDGRAWRVSAESEDQIEVRTLTPGDA